MDEPEPVAWYINVQFPFGYRAVFPNGIDGVDIANETNGKATGFLWNRGKTDEAKMKESACRLFAAMDLPTVPQRELGIHFRGHRADGKKLPEFAHQIREAMAETSGEIATLCDSQREPISEIIGERMIHQRTHEMTHDMDRASLDVRQFLVEWWNLLNCRRIVTNCPNSSLAKLKIHLA